MSWLSRIKSFFPRVPVSRPGLNRPTIEKMVAPAKKVVDLTRDTFEAATAPARRGAKQLLGGVVDPIRDAARGGLRIAYEGAEKIIPDGTLDKGLTLTERGLDVLDKGVSAVAGEDSRVASIVHDLARVDFEGISRDDGLQGDWFDLWKVWLFEEKPASLGTWDKTPDGRDRVTVTDPRYLNDLANRPHQQEALDAFLKKYPQPKVGDSIEVPFAFTGEGSASGEYTAVEWFIGSYNTRITCVGVDEKTGRAQLQFEVTNNSHWYSATRLPASFQEKGLPENLIDDTRRDRGVGLGGDFIQRYVWTKTVDIR